MTVPTPQPTTITIPTNKLFKASDVPRLQDTAKYEDWRSDMRDFFLSENAPAPEDDPKALKRITRCFDMVTTATIEEIKTFLRLYPLPRPVAVGAID